MTKDPPPQTSLAMSTARNRKVPVEGTRLPPPHSPPGSGGRAPRPRGSAALSCSWACAQRRGGSVPVLRLGRLSPDPGNGLPTPSAQGLRSRIAAVRPRPSRPPAPHCSSSQILGSGPCREAPGPAPRARPYSGRQAHRRRHPEVAFREVLSRRPQDPNSAPPALRRSSRIRRRPSPLPHRGATASRRRRLGPVAGTTKAQGGRVRY